ncbi:MAG: LysM peptidoglycan-binding domain-containing protein [Bacilli bacterium]
MYFSGGDGAEVVYSLRNNSKFAKTILDEIEKEGQNVRKYYQLRLPSNPIKDYYFILRDTPNTEAVLIEYGFIDSPNDDVEQIKKDYERYGEAVVRAITKYKNLKYTAPVGSAYYVVQKGDSLWSIATKYNLSVNKLKEINNLTNNILSVGQVLNTTATEEKLPEDYLLYTVKPGDSLYSIALLYKTTVDTLMKINNLKNSNLSINQQIFLPKQMSEKKYIVKAGDTLSKIASLNNVSVTSLKKANNLTSDFISINQELVIPIKEEEIIDKSEGINYIVDKGDNLYSIANKYNVSVNDIKKANMLSNNLISIGQVLVIPGTKDYATYIVKKGDSLYSIAKQYNINVNNLKLINNLNSNVIDVNQELLIPSK